MVRIQNEFSSYTHINIDVPLGTLLRPPLFLIYINDIFKFINSVK